MGCLNNLNKRHGANCGKSTGQAFRQLGSSPRAVIIRTLTNVSPGACFLIRQRQEWTVKASTQCSEPNMSPKGLPEKRHRGPTDSGSGATAPKALGFAIKEEYLTVFTRASIDLSTCWSQSSGVEGLTRSHLVNSTCLSVSIGRTAGRRIRTSHSCDGE